MFFKKKNKAQKQIRDVDYFVVIEPKEIKSLKKPPFEQGAYGSESDYRRYLEEVQPLFDEYESTGNIHTISYASMDEISEKRDEKRFLDNFRVSFLDCSQYVNVGRTLDGRYTVVSNGRHRMYVAKKYNLRLLVHVTQEEVLRN